MIRLFAVFLLMAVSFGVVVEAHGEQSPIVGFVNFEIKQGRNEFCRQVFHVSLGDKKAPFRKGDVIAWFFKNELYCFRFNGLHWEDRLGVNCDSTVIHKPDNNVIWIDRKVKEVTSLLD